MTVRLIHWKGVLPRAALLAATAALLPVPAFAGEGMPAQKPTSIRTSVREVVAREVAAMPARHAVTRRAAAQASSSKESPAFFKTGPGIAALVVMAAGVGYALYSTQNDRLTSPAKE